MLGTTSENTKIVDQNQWGYGFVTAGTISFNNIASTNKFFTDATINKRLVGAYGEAGVSYKDLIYLTATGRNDWSSTLPIANRSYFIPLSVVLLFLRNCYRKTVFSHSVNCVEAGRELVKMQMPTQRILM